jgi:putative intracellular protease/amidase
VHNSSNGAPFRNGFDFKVIKGFNDASVFDVLWVRGGDPTALAHLMENRTYLDFLLRQSATARYVASVCEGHCCLPRPGCSTAIWRRRTGRSFPASWNGFRRC